MRPWRVSVGLTASAAALAVWVLWVEVDYLRPYWWLVAERYGLYLGAYGATAVMSLGVGIYATARAVSLGAVGRKVGVVERTIRRGGGEEPELAAALARDDAGDYDS